MVKLEIFSGDPPCPGCVAIVELVQRVAARYEGELGLVIYEGAEGLEKFETLRGVGVLAVAYENPGVKVYEVLER